MHKYIDFNKIRDFSKPLTYKEVKNDIVNVYKITNILDDFEGEALYCICEALLDDYNIGRCNYKSYIEKGIDARLLMELRKSAVFYFPDRLDFYTGHAKCNTWREVRQFRKEYISSYYRGYSELGVDYYYFSIFALKDLSKGYLFDYEYCFADGDGSLTTDIEDYKNAWVNAFMPKEYWVEAKELVS